MLHLSLKTNNYSKANKCSTHYNIILTNFLHKENAYNFFNSKCFIQDALKKLSAKQPKVYTYGLHTI